MIHLSGGIMLVLNHRTFKLLGEVKNHWKQNICDPLRNLVQFVQFKRRQKHP